MNESKLNRDDMREAYDDLGRDGISNDELKLLRKEINKEMKASGCFRGSFKMHGQAKRTRIINPTKSENRIMNNAETQTVASKLVRESNLLADTFIGLEHVGKAEPGQTMIKIHSGQEIMVHKKEDTLALLEKQQHDLIDSMRAALNKIDNRPLAD